MEQENDIEPATNASARRGLYVPACQAVTFLRNSYSPSPYGLGMNFFEIVSAIRAL
jgi:hypothetical protein